MITSSSFIKAATAAGLLGGASWVLDVPTVARDWANLNTVQAVNELKLIHKDDMADMFLRVDDGFRDVRIEMATSLHRAIESSKISSRIHDFKLEVFKLRAELRSTTTPHKTKEIDRDIDRIEKDIERERNRLDKIETLTKAQIGELIDDHTEA